ncbi:MAG: DUF4130 domain-containing protein [Candidatus Methanofastidiosa archaeon]|nr:DUF4130 domain-containing protein [Candidatus Methanofastidiosa archaeon]
MIRNNYLKYLSCHCSCTEALYDFASKLSPKEIENARSAKVSSIRSMVSSVQSEIHKMRGYVRLAPVDEIVLYGYLRPKHRIGEQVANIFAHRYPKTIIVLGNANNSWVSLYTAEGLYHMSSGPLDEVVEKLRQLTNSPDKVDTIENIWECYYKSQYRPERRNLKYFHRNMTLTSLRSARLRTESNKCGNTLDKYMGV